MSQGEPYSRFYPYGIFKHKHRPNFTPGNDQIFVYKMYRGTPWIKLAIAAIIGIYIGQNYNFPKIEGPFKMFGRFREYCQQHKIKTIELTRAEEVPKSSTTEK